MLTSRASSTTSAGTPVEIGEYYSAGEKRLANAITRFEAIGTHLANQGDANINEWNALVQSARHVRFRYMQPSMSTMNGFSLVKAIINESGK